MREYAKVSPQFWHGETGQKLRDQGVETQLMAFYLLTSPHANQIGLYFLPLGYAAHDTGLDHLQVVTLIKMLGNRDLAFCRYDNTKQCVWVENMAAWQIAPVLQPSDKQIIGIRAMLRALPRTKLIWEFWERYSNAFCLGNWDEMQWPLEAPPKPLRSKEKEKENETENEKEKEIHTPIPKIKSSREKQAQPESLETILGKTFGGFKSVSSGELAKQITDQTQEPWNLEAWEKMLDLIKDHPDGWRFVMEKLEYVRVCNDPILRKVKDRGPLKNNGAAYMFGHVTDWCKKNGFKKWPSFPKRPTAGATQ